jgi:hypothetical protein
LFNAKTVIPSAFHNSEDWDIAMQNNNVAGKVLKFGFLLSERT